MNTKTLNSHPSSLNLVLTRLFTKGEYTHGSLSIDGNKICSTLKNANSLVPSGDYVISLIKCKQYARKMPCLNAAAPCDLCPKLKFVCINSTLPCHCPMLKPGNASMIGLMEASKLANTIA